MPAFLDRLSAAIDALLSPTPVRDAAPAPTSSRASGGRLSKPAAGPSPNIDRYPTVLGPALTPAHVSTALRNAEQGRMRTLCDLLSEQRETVTHLQAELGKREDAIASCEWQVLPAKTDGMGKRAERLAKKHAEYAAWRVDALRDDLRDRIKHLAGGVYFGRSGVEIEWMRDAKGIAPRALHSVHPKRFSYAKDWRVHLYDEYGNELNADLGRFPGVDIRETWPDKFIIHEPQTIGAELPTRQGLGRVLVYAAMFWRWNARHWMQFAELHASPWRVGYYDKGADEDDIEVLRQGLIELSGLTTAVFPESCKPMFLQAKDTRTHGDLHGAWLAEISKVVNGGTLQSSMNGSSGSRAAAEVHEREGDKLTAGDGAALDATITRDLLRPLIRLNFGAEAAALYCPRFHLVTERPEDVAARAGRIWAFIDRGGEVAMDDVREVTTGLKAPEKGAKLLLPLGAIGPAAKAAVAKNPDEPKPESEKPNDDEDEDDAPAGAKPDSDENAESEKDDDAEDA